MLNYDKVIIDTSNIFYRVSAFYVKSDLNPTELNKLMKSNVVVNYYKEVVQKFLSQTLGTVCLLFDPLFLNGQMSERLKIKEGYKLPRDKNSPINQLRIDTLEKLYTTYVLEPVSRLEIYRDNKYEADDFAEKLTEFGKCLLVTSDEDFTRYLETNRVEMLTAGLSIKEDNIFTAKDFEKKYGFKPNITSVVFWKALYGDVSDNIVGSFKNLKTKVIKPADEEMRQILVEFGNEETDLATAKINFFAGSGRFSKLKELLILSNTNCSYEQLLNLTDENFRVIESMLPRTSDIDINKFKVELEVKTNDKRKFSLNRR